MAVQPQTQPRENSTVRREVNRLLESTPAFQQLDKATQRALKDSMTKITGYLSQQASPFSRQPWAGQLAPPDLQQKLAPQGAGSSPITPAPTSPTSPTTPSTSGSGQGATGRVGEVARATLSAIDFPGFVSSLIKGTFQAIVDASIQQMEAYAELLKNVASTVDRFMQDNVSDGMAQDYLADKYGGFLNRDTSSGQPRLTVNRDAARNGEMPGFFRDLGFENPNDIDDEAVQQVVVPAARRTMAETRQQTLATMVLMGINRVLVDDGEITAKLQFHIDASETMGLRFDQTKTTMGNIAGQSGRSPFSANAIMVNTTSLNAQSDINVRADLTGQVKVKFRSESFPLERFADSAAIQLINQNARVPPPTPPPAAKSETTTPAAATAPTPAPPPSSAPKPATPPPAPPPASAPRPATQSLSDDPWAPR